MSTDPNTLHCREDPTSCRGESYCACQCDQCKAAWEAGREFYAIKLLKRASQILGRSVTDVADEARCKVLFRVIEALGWTSENATPDDEEKILEEIRSRSRELAHLLGIMKSWRG
jgi:hypothetical protein